MRLRLQRKLKDLDDAEESLQSARDAFLKHEGWRHLRDRWGHAFSTWEHFCRTKKPFGLGTTANAIDAEVTRRLGNHGGDHKSGHFKNQGYNITLIPSRGSRAAYLLARLERDGEMDPERADLADRVRLGELKPYRAARIAGIVKTKTLLEQLHALWRKASPDERQAFLHDISTGDIGAPPTHRRRRHGDT